MTLTEADRNRIERCSGAGSCASPHHFHGCYADLDGSACEEPEEHPARRWARNAREIAEAMRDGHPPVDPAWIATILDECAALIEPETHVSEEAERG